MREGDAETLELLIRHELVIGRLYDALAGLFKAHAGFWRLLAAEEQKHARWLSELQSNPVAARWLLHDRQFRPQAIKASIGYVEQQISRAAKGELGLVQALSIAKDLEYALLEQQFAKVSESVPAEVGTILMNLADETRRHMTMVAEVLESEKQKRP